MLLGVRVSVGTGRVSPAELSWIVVFVCMAPPEREWSESFNLQQGVAQGYGLSPTLFSVFINGLVEELEQSELGTELTTGLKISGMLFADDFVGVSERISCRSL